MAGPEIYIAWRGLDFEELENVSSSAGVQFHRLQLGDSSIESTDRFRSALRSSLVVIRLAGTDPRATLLWIRNLVGDREWLQRSAHILLRTQDSHVQSTLEKSVDSEVDFWILSHPAHSNHLSPSKVRVVPLGIEGLSRRRALEIAQEERPKPDLDVLCMMNLYVGGARNYHAFRLSRDLKRLGVSTFFGTIKPAGREDAGMVYRSWRRARVAINLPMRKDFNIRNFETALAGVRTITVNVPGHEIFPELGHNVFFNEDFDSAADQILHLLQESAEACCPELPLLVAQRHLSNDRLYEILQKTVGVTISSPETLKNVELPPVSSSLSAPIRERHSDLKLLVSSSPRSVRTGPIRHRRLDLSDHILDVASVPIRAALNLLSTARKVLRSAVVGASCTWRQSSIKIRARS